MSTSGGSSGGATPTPTYAGAGSPEGVQTAAVGKSYVDTTNGALYWKMLGAGNTGWALAGVRTAPGDVPGVMVDANGMLYLLAGADQSLNIGDTSIDGAIGNALTWSNTGVDGAQSLLLSLGSAGQFAWRWKQDGTTVIPGPVTVAGDETFDTNAHGPVLVDTTDGHTYRIKSTAGVLGTTQVT